MLRARLHVSDGPAESCLGLKCLAFCDGVSFTDKCVEEKRVRVTKPLVF